MSLDGERMAALRQRFEEAAAPQVVQLETMLRNGDLEGARSLAHSLAGRAGMFGHAELGEIAREVDEAALAELPMRAERLLTALRGLAQAR